VIVGLDHVQLAFPDGAEDRMRAFYCDILGMNERPKPAVLQARGGFWAHAGGLEFHFGVDPDFHPATKAHPAFIISDLQALANKLTAAGYQANWDTALPNVTRFFSDDPVGNRIECIAKSA
jgi:catechol 2,3-dioxygenase-like lactoylglutathione lyase family enzyme